MLIERISQTPGRMPDDVYEQLEFLPPEFEQQKICSNLYNRVTEILNYHAITFYPEESTYRVKSREDIRKKSITRGSISPVRDIYGVRIIVSDEDRFKVQDLFQPHFPLTPTVFTDGRPSIREYANPEVRNYMRSRFNPNIGEYSALHVNVVFSRNNARFYDIAEIQVMTKNELAVSCGNRSLYTNGRGKK